MRSAVGVFAGATWGRDSVRPRTGMSPRVRATGDEPSADLTKLDDGALVRAFQGGNRDAFDVIVVRHRRQVYHLCRRFVRNHEDASDLAQDVSCARSRAAVQGDASLMTWLYRIGERLSVAWLRSGRNRPGSTRRPTSTRERRSAARNLRGERAVAVQAAIESCRP